MKLPQARHLRRVVITGVGAVTPLGCGIEGVWRRVLAGECGVSRLPAGYLPANVPVYVAARVPRGEAADAYHEERVFGRSVSKEMADFAQFACHASDLALIHGEMDATKGLDAGQRERMGVALASGGIGSLQEITEAQAAFTQSFKKLSPYFVPKVLVNMAGGAVSLRHGLKGPLHTVATACAAGLHAVGDAFNFIRLGHADRMLAGGSEASIDPLALAGFARLRALSGADDVTASRPFDATRAGFVMGEGACLLVLEELSAAQARGASIIAEIAGYGLSSDAHHATLPAPSGDGALRSMSQAMWDAGIAPKDVGYVHAHATSTPQGDAIEAQAIAALFAGRPPDCAPLRVSSTKGATGHLLGAAGALELAFTALSLRDATLPPTIHLQSSDIVLPAGASFEHVAGKGLVLPPREAADYEYALKNSFGFGGTNASLVLRRFRP